MLKSCYNWDPGCYKLEPGIAIRIFFVFLSQKTSLYTSQVLSNLVHPANLLQYILPSRRKLAGLSSKFQQSYRRSTDGSGQLMWRLRKMALVELTQSAFSHSLEGVPDEISTINRRNLLLYFLPALVIHCCTYFWCSFVNCKLHVVWNTEPFVENKKATTIFSSLDLQTKRSSHLKKRRQ